MAVEIFVRKRLGALWPTDPNSERLVEELPWNRTLKVTVRRPRSIQHHRLYWGLVHKVFENQSIYESPDVLSDVLKVAAGYYTLVHDKHGQPYFRIPKSISFSKMDQTEFNQFFDRVVQVVVTQIIPGLDDAALRSEIADMLQLEDQEQ